MLTELPIALGDKYEEVRNNNELIKEELELFIKWEVVIKVINNLPDTEIYEQLIIYLYTDCLTRRVQDYH